LLGEARRAGLWLPFECGWGSCGTCKVSLVEGTTESLFPDAPARSERDARARRILTCQSVATSDLTIKPLRVSDAPRDGLATRDVSARLCEVEALGPNIHRFTFRLPEVVPYLEGQYAKLEVAPGLWRCYSMADLAGSEVVTFIAKRYEGGAGSNALFALPLGAQVAMELPYGAMSMAQSEAPVVLVAGGTGISPILALVRGLAATVDPRPVRVFYGAGSPADLAAWDELEKLVGQLPDGELVGSVVVPDPGWSGVTGLVTTPLAGCVELTGADVYLAGPPVMVDAVLAVLRAAGIAIDRIHYDRFG
jgi:NAD(P)H-flavin reductase/ferredoxin